MTLALGLALAGLSALASNIGLLRHRGAVAAPDVDTRRPLRSAVGLFRQKWWTIGYLVAALAYVLHSVRCRSRRCRSSRRCSPGGS